MKSLHLLRQQAGTTLVEVLVAIGLAGIMLPALATALVSSYTSRPTSVQELQATSLLRATSDAARSVREAGWSNVATDGTYHPVISGNSWTLASGSEIVGNLTRQIVIGPVERDSGGIIVASGGSVDPSTKIMTITVSWSIPSSGSVSNDIYLTRWQQNTTWVQTTQADFTAGTLANTVVTNTNGGEVQLDSNGAGGYQSSGTFESATFDAGTDVGWQSITFTASVPGDSSLKFQLASNDDNSTWSYLGPDGTAGSYFSSPDSIPPSIATGRYIRYKAFLAATSDASLTPVLSDITINYSR